MNYATMDRAGRVVMPKKVREQLHLEDGARFKVEVVGGRIELVPEDDDSELVEVDGWMVVRSKDGKKLKPGAIRAAIIADREDRMDRIAGRGR